MNALVLPDYRDANAYQDLLAKALMGEGISVSFPDGYRRGLPLTRGLASPPPNVLHLHWINAYLHGETKLTRALYAAKFLVDVRMVRAQGVRLVWTMHNLRTHDTQFPGIDVWTRRQLSKCVDAVIVHDPSTRKDVIEEYGASPDCVFVIPHGHYRSLYDTSLSREAAFATLDLSPPQGRLFLHLGILRPYKGVDNLLKAWRRHAQNHPDDRLQIAGKALNPAYGEHLRRAAANVPGVDLRLGYVDDALVPAYYAAADLVVLPFRNITTSGSLLLAASFGVPVVAPNFEGLQFVIDDADDLFYSASATSPLDALEEALHNASTHPDLGGLRARTRRACDALNWDHIAVQTKAVYQGVSAPVLT